MEVDVQFRAAKLAQNSYRKGKPRGERTKQKQNCCC